MLAVAEPECQRVRPRTSSRRAPQTSRLNSSFESSRPRVVSTIRSASSIVRSSAARAQPNTSASGGSWAAVRGRPRSVRSPRIAVSAAAVARSSVSAPPGGRPGWPSGSLGRRERLDVSPEMGGVPAPRHAVEGVGARADRLVRPALPVGEVVAALVARPRPVADLVAAPAELGQSVHGVVVLRGGPVLVLLRRAPGRASGVRRAGSAGGRRPARSGPPRPGRRASGRRATGGPARGRARPRACRSRSSSEPSGTSYSRSRLIEPMPPSRARATASATSAGRWRRPSRRSSAAIQALGAERDPVDPGPGQGRRVAALVGPGVRLDRDLGAVGDAEPLANSSSRPGDVVGRQERRRPAAEVDGVERRRGRVPGGPKRASRASARRAISARAPPRTPRSGSSARAWRRRPRRRSRSTGRARRRTGRGRTARPAGAGLPRPRSGEAQARPRRLRPARSPIPGRRLPWPDDAPALRRPSLRLDLLDLAAARQELAGVAGREEHREPGDGVAEERGRDPARDRASPSRRRGRSRAP